jgi:hypothetical protein
MFWWRTGGRTASVEGTEEEERGREVHVGWVGDLGAASHQPWVLTPYATGLSPSSLELRALPLGAPFHSWIQRC